MYLLALLPFRIEGCAIVERRRSRTLNYPKHDCDETRSVGEKSVIDLVFMVMER